MPEIKSDILGLAVDLAGCPNRCRHCYLGAPAQPTLSVDDLRWAAGRFCEFTANETNWTPIRRLSVSSRIWEPDYADNYRYLYEVEAEVEGKGPGVGRGV